ncbi:MAG TPA: Smr/MutS family protein [Ferrovibrio sp.]|jgi:DNA-nicking Smr family endonuclease|uniref:Smr/MutS family protein n=1 Tax=Ferrovibrio sp. TaxID=1917215 RepID=UPI002ED3530D
MAPRRFKGKPEPVLPDHEAWQNITAGVKPLPRNHAPKPLAPLPRLFKPDMPGPAALHRAEAKKKAPLTGRHGRDSDSAPLPQMDARLKQRLVRGQIPIEARLDLHGLTLKEAERAMDRLLRHAVAARQRCLLVITGKGISRAAPADMYEKRGVLRTWLPDWLKRGPWRDQVLGIAPARQEQGGAGAFYVLLRRQRET